MLDNVPIDDGSDKPLGYVSPDGELKVVITNGERHYQETELGQTRRWMRQAPDLYEMYLKAVEDNAQMRDHVTRIAAEYAGKEKAIESDRIDNLEDWEKQCLDLAKAFNEQGLAASDPRLFGAGDALEQIAKMLREERLSLTPRTP